MYWYIRSVYKLTHYKWIAANFELQAKFYRRFNWTKSVIESTFNCWHFSLFPVFLECIDLYSIWQETYYIMLV